MHGIPVRSVDGIKLKQLMVNLLQKNSNIFSIVVCISEKGCYLCIPLRRRRLFLEGFRFGSGWFSGPLFGGRAAEKKLKINFAGMEKVLTFAVPNETGSVRHPRRDARGI